MWVSVFHSQIKLTHNPHVQRGLTLDAQQKNTDSHGSKLPTASTSQKNPIPAERIGVTFKLSEKAVAELDRIQEEAIKAARESREFFWC